MGADLSTGSANPHWAAGTAPSCLEEGPHGLLHPEVPEPQGSSETLGEGQACWSSEGQRVELTCP